jgi:subtilisin family serine protease
MARARPGRTVVGGYRSPGAFRAALRAQPASVVRRIPGLDTVVLRPRGPVRAFAAAFARRPGIEYVHALAWRHAHVDPALFADQLGNHYEWQYAAARVDTVPDWVLRAASTVTIAVVDTGADLLAPDIAAKAAQTWDIRLQGTDVRDYSGHGTFVASLAAGSITNDDGIAGFGGDAHLLIVRAGQPDGAFTDLDEATGIVYAVDHGAKIVNLSLGGRRSSPTEQRAIDYAVAHGVLLVAAAGNERERGNPIEFPAALLQPVLSNGIGGRGLVVGASTSDRQRASFSSTGSWISLAAPGNNVLGAVSTLSSPADYPRFALTGAREGLYGYSSGTSFATPEVSGAAALVWAANPSLDARGVAEILKQTASGAGTWTPDLGFGVIDVAAAVASANRAPTVLVAAQRSGDRVHLTWSSIASAYRIAAAQDGSAARVLLSATTHTEAWFRLASGHSYTFTVTALDSTGAETVTSKPLALRVARKRH